MSAVIDSTSAPSVNDTNTTPVEEQKSSSPQEFDPTTFVPSLPQSDHLDFVVPTVDSSVSRVMNACVILQGENPSEAVAQWLTDKLVSLTNTVNEAKDAAHLTNARRLAERVVHKFHKWGPVRFGTTSTCQSCFYTGRPAIDSASNPITYDPIFEAQVREVAGSEADTILNSLHIGSQSAERFRDFIKVPDYGYDCGCPHGHHHNDNDDDDDDEDNEDNDDNESTDSENNEDDN